MSDQFTNQNPHEPVTDAYTAATGPQSADIPTHDSTPTNAETNAHSANTRPVSYQRPNPADLRARRRQREEGFEFVLHATTDANGNPTVVRAKRPDIFDADSLGSLPQQHQQAVFDLITETERAERSATTDDEREAMQRMSVADFARSYGNVAHIADAYVLLGFIEPRVYATAAEADEKDGLWVKDIEFADRMAFMTHVTEMQQGAAAQAATFPARPDAAVDAGPAGTPVSGAGVAQPDTAYSRAIDPIRIDERRG